MRQTLSREHRKILETTVAQARVHAEAGAEKTLKALAVGAKDAPAHATDAQKKLRVRLRAHSRALGDDFLPSPSGRGAGAGGEGESSSREQSLTHLVTEIAYEHWHRMLFARFLAESDLLMHPDGYPVSLADCKEDAETFDPPARSEWEVAGHYASAMLPNVFRPDSPALALQLPMETEQALEALLAKLPVTVFQADDSLGWSYQFWQAPKKEEVQRQMKQAGTKVGADELPAVTQLFTEQYMVAFLLENALGGWWMSRHPRMKLPVEMPYLRTASVAAASSRLDAEDKRLEGASTVEAASSHLDGIDKRLEGASTVEAASSRFDGIDKRLEGASTVEAASSHLDGIDKRLEGASTVEAASSRFDDKRMEGAATELWGYFKPDEPVANQAGNLPHWRQEGVTYFVTFRCADSLPQEKLMAWQREREEWLRLHPEPHDNLTRAEYYRRFTARIEHWLDQGYGQCQLAELANRSIVENALRHFDGQRYHLGEFVVMPNHVHVIVTPLPGHDLSDILHSWKSYTAGRINQRAGHSGAFWQKESFDHILRSPEHHQRVVQYIRAHPVKMRLEGASTVEAASSRLGSEVEAPSSRLNKRLEGASTDASTPAAGTFPAWPDTLAQFKLLDPCAGSGHFLVSAFHYLVPMRRATEKLSVRDAIDKVLADNLHGLELDARCVEIAAFALALAAWRYPDENGNPIGYRPLPRLNIACVGVAPRSKKADWLKLAGGDERLEGGMAALYALFQKAPELGSLIDPMAATRGDLLDAHWQELESRLEQALAQKGDEQEIEARVAAQGMVRASRILTCKYHLVITNPPYLGTGDHGPVLKGFCEEHYKAAKGDLANVFLERSLKLCTPGGTVSFVMPQNWLFLKGYQKQREHLLKYAVWNLLARLGEKGFDSAAAAGAFTILLTVTHTKPSESQVLRGLDASAPKTPEEKAVILAKEPLVEVGQLEQLGNPDSRVSFEKLDTHAKLLATEADSYQGMVTGDLERFVTLYWENRDPRDHGWVPFRTTIDALDSALSGVHHTVLWESGVGQLANYAAASRDRLHDMHESGNRAWRNDGVAINRMRGLRVAHYFGEHFDNNVAVVIPKRPESLAAIWCFLSSEQFLGHVRSLDTTLKVTNQTLLKVPFDLAHWQKVAAERYPNGLPKPYSDDPTQWIFHGHPKPATDPLQVAVARLLGYRWPAESDAEMELSDEARAWIGRCKDLDGLIDDDGIVCLPAVRGEPAAVDRLRALLAKAFGGDWSAARESQLLRDAGCDGLPLAQWLRDKFFEQHVARFQKRPFIWHIWDGHKEGFSALVNYHLLTREKLNTLINLYLGDWITQQKRAVDAGNADATLKLAKAEALKAQLEAILEGEPPYDIFVRWKPLHQQPLGWEPDINDGVRMNIRPFVEAGVLRIPRAKLGIKWEADRGKDVASAPWYKLGPTYGEPEGTRINDHHTTLAEKKAARAALTPGPSPRGRGEKTLGDSTC